MYVVFLAFFSTHIYLTQPQPRCRLWAALYQGISDHFSTHQLRTITDDISLQITDQLRAILRLRRGCLFDFFGQRVGKFSPPHMTDVNGATRVERLHRGSARLREPREGYGRSISVKTRH